MPVYAPEKFGPTLSHTKPVIPCNLSHIAPAPRHFLGAFLQMNRNWDY
jgi:hypothetical protein